MSGVAAAAAQHIDMRQCRICLGGPDEELGRLIKPCLCKGSIKVRSKPTWHTMVRSCVSHRLSIHVVCARTMPEYLAGDLSEYRILLELSTV